MTKAMATTFAPVTLIIHAQCVSLDFEQENMVLDPPRQRLRNYTLDAKSLLSVFTVGEMNMEISLPLSLPYQVAGPVMS